MVEMNSRMSFYGVIVVFVVVFVVFMPNTVKGHSHDAFSPAPAPVPATASDGTTIDQGIAYVLMLLALVLTYLIHTMDVPLNFLVN